MQPDTDSVAVLKATDSYRSYDRKPRVADKQPAASTSLPGSLGMRLLKTGRLAGGLVSGAVAEGVRRLATGKTLSARDLVLTHANAACLSDRLAEFRGAAMKVGQLLSMEAGGLLPSEFTSILERLRDDAHAMPLGQVAAVLNDAWGEGRDERFERFMFTPPAAAASIGQVHEAVTRDQQHLAIKTQYPRVRESIDSDVDNVASLLRLTRMLPSGVDLTPLLQEAKKQLHQEADNSSEWDRSHWRPATWMPTRPPPTRRV